MESYFSTTVYSDNFLKRNYFKQMLAAFLGQMFTLHTEKNISWKAIFVSKQFSVGAICFTPGRQFSTKVFPHLIFPTTLRKEFVVASNMKLIQNYLWNKKSARVFPFAKHMLRNALTSISISVSKQFSGGASCFTPGRQFSTEFSPEPEVFHILLFPQY